MVRRKRLTWRNVERLIWMLGQLLILIQRFRKAI